MTNQTPYSQTPAWDAQLDLHDLEGKNLPEDPLAFFGQWFSEAKTAGMIEPTGATLATSDRNGKPSARTVLVKSFDAEGFYFYTNYESRKGRQLAENPQAALLFWWDKLERQVRIEGRVEKLETDASDRYFANRPHGSQIGAHASPQSRPIANREELVEHFSDAEAKFDQGAVPRPDNWGGYRLQAELIEFWQGRKNRLHDRLCFQRTPDGWITQRLAP